MTASSTTGDVLLPSKAVAFNGTAVNIDGRSTIDLRGGGDIQAMEFVPGKGGSSDVLAASAGQPTVYALLPSQTAPVAAFDKNFSTGLGDVNPLAGQQIYLQGGNGIAAGLYTLYPAHYATLPGALRVVDYGSALAKPGQAGQTLPDGTQIIAGYTTQSTNPAARSSGTELFKVQTNAVWRQYSEIDSNSANAYFAAKAQHDGTIVPYLPMDAGRLAINAQQSLNLIMGGLAGALTAPAAGGRGSELDVSASQLALLGPGQTAPPNYVGVDVTQLGNFESVLIGGLRTNLVDGSVLITPFASQVLVDTQGAAFTAPEIILIATPMPIAANTMTIAQTFTWFGNSTGVKLNLANVATGTVTAGTGNIVVNPGSIIEATGMTGYQQPRRYVLPSSSAAAIAAALGGTLSADGTTITGANIASLQNNDPKVLSLLRAYSGSFDYGAMMALTSDSSLTISSLSGRDNSVPLKINFVATTGSTTTAVAQPLTLFAGNGNNTGSISIGANVDISAASMTLNATRTSNAISIDPSIKLNANALSLIARNFAIGTGVPSNVAVALSGQTFDQLAQGRNLSLKAVNGGIDLYGALDLDSRRSSLGLTFDTPWLAGHGDQASISTLGTLTLTNSGAAPSSTAPTVAGETLTMTAGEIDIGGGTQTLAGFDTIVWKADTRVFVKASGKLTLGIDSTPVALNVTTPNLLVGAGTSLGGGTGSQFALTTAGNVKIQRPDPFTLDATGSHPVQAGVPYLFADGTPPGEQVVFSVGGTITSAQGLVTTFGANNPVTLDPGSTVILSASGGTVALQTGNAPIAIAYAAKPATTTENGGDFQINAASFDDSGTIQVQAGTLTIHTTGTATDATTGVSFGIRLADGAYIAAGGYKQSFFDLDEFLSGGKAVLTADAGKITTGRASTINLSQPLDAQGNRGLAFGGELDVTAAAGNADLNGTIDTTATGGRGGVFHLDAVGLEQHGPTDNPFDRLAQALSDGGVTGEINIHTHSGNLVLSAGKTLQANNVTLVADTDKAIIPPNALVADTTANGNVTIAGTIDARGYDGTTSDGSNEAGGQVGLWGANSVTLASTGWIRASTSHPDERGGDVAIGVSWNAPWDRVNKVGGINLQDGSRIDVSGGTKGGLADGTVRLRAPSDGNNDVMIQHIGSTVTGASAVNVEGYVSFSTDGTGGGINASSLKASNGTTVTWDGIVDPAGWFSSSGALVNGAWAGLSGWKLNVTAGTGYTAPPTITLSVNGAVTGTVVTSLKVVTLTVTSGGEFTSIPSTINFAAPGNAGLASGGTAAQATVSSVGLAHISISNGPSGVASGAAVTITGGTAGTAATGTAVVDASGHLTGVNIAFASSGSGYTGAPTSIKVGLAAGGTATLSTGLTATYTVKSMTVAVAGEGYVAPATVSSSNAGTGQLTAPVVTANMGVVATVTSLGNAADLAPTVTTVAGTGGSGFAASVASSTTLTGTESGGVFVPGTAAIGFVMLATDGTNTNGQVAGIGQGTGIFTPTATAVNTAHSLFYTDILEQVAQGKWSSYGLSNASTRLGSTVQLQPGIELVNPNPAINNGDITVASTWNLAAGTAYKSTGVALTATDTYSFTDSSIAFNYRYNGITPGALTLSAVGNVNVNASISDGFFQFRNYNDSTYFSNLINNYVNTIASSVGTGGTRSADGDVLNGLIYNRTTGALIALPVAPYAPLANKESPTVTGTTTLGVTTATNNPLLAGDDVFPSGLRICIANCTTASQTLAPSSTIPGSWSYRLTAGAEVGSANPNAVQPLSNFGSGHGNVVISGRYTYAQKTLVASSNNLSTMIGTALVNIPTMLRTGTGSITITVGQDFTFLDPLAPGVVYTAGVNTAPLTDPVFSANIAPAFGGGFSFNQISAKFPDGFLEPQVLFRAAQSVSGGSVTFHNVYGPPTAAAFPQLGGDITINAQRDVVGFQNAIDPAQSSNSFAEFYTPWMLATASSSVSILGAGVYAPGTTVPLQSAWWIEFGSFDQGVMSAGGNVTVNAGRDLRDFSVSLPTTARVSGGLSVVDPVTGGLNVPLPQVYGSGNLIVRVGRELDSGSFYEGSGHASIVVRGSVAGDWQGVFSPPPTQGINTVAIVKFGTVNPVLAVDSGQISLTAGGAVAITSIVNPAELSAGMDTYGPNSAVRLAAAGGNIAVGAAPNLVGSTLYPGTIEMVAFSGSITLPGSTLVLASTLHGSLDLLAGTTLDLIGGQTLGVGVSIGALSAGSSLIDAAFNPYEPNNGFDAATSKPLLAHAGDTGADHIYALSGDIRGGGSVLINRPVEVQAGRDITNLNLTAENIAASDVSSVIAGRDIVYSGWVNTGGLQIAGPGFFMVEAGRDLGPFLPLAHDTSTAATVQEGITSLGNSSAPGSFPVGNAPTLQLVGVANPEFTGASGKGKRNFLLPDTGASIVAMFGISKGINYQGVIDSYIDPARSSDFSNYLSNFAAFLVQSGKASYASNGTTLVNLKDVTGVELPLFNSLDPATQQTFLKQINFDDPAVHIPELRNFLLGQQFDLGKVYWPVFNGLSKPLQDVFVVDLFEAHLKAVGEPDNANFQKYQVGYQMINTLFPAGFGYTQNALGGGTNGANQLVHTGNLNLLHSTIQTMKGGDISVLGPGGSILVGSVATEPNANLKLNNLGILTLAGGAISTFTDQDVLVNASRVFTEFGGDITMWSSNGNLDAGRGAKTTLSLPPLTVNFNQDDIESINLGGLVTGAGIGVLRTQAFAIASDAILLAPRGTIDAGDAGIRSSGNLSVLALHLLNADNIQVAGKTTGIPTIPVPDAGKLTSASNTAGAAQKSAEVPQQKPDDRPSIIIVEILGYGGGNDTAPPQDNEDHRDKTGQHSYNTNGAVQILGHGELTEQEKQFLNEDERRRL